MGIKSGARLREVRAILRAFSGFEGRGPHDLDQSEVLAICRDMAAMGRLMRALRWARALGDRQSGKPGPRGRPVWRTALRSGGKVNPNSASARANSGSDNPGWSSVPEDWSRVMSLEAREEREIREGRGVGGVGPLGPDAARAERRRSPAM